ncbi:RHS repeat-associated protein [Streptacidiphilus sp. EB103A]
MRRHLSVARGRRLLSAVTVLSAAAMLLGAPSASAVSAHKPKQVWLPHADQAQTSVPIHNVATTAQPKPVAAKSAAVAPVAWPAAAAADVSLVPAATSSTPSDLVASSTARLVTDGPLPVVQKPASPHAAPGVPVVVGAAGALDGKLLPPTKATRDAAAADKTAATPAAVHVAVASQAAAQRAGVSGLMISLSRTDTSSTSERVSVGLDYSSIRDAFGGGYSDRLRLVSYPACVLTTPQAKGCSVGTPVAASANDTAHHRLVTDVTLPATAPAARSLDAAAATGAGPLASKPVVEQSGVVVLTGQPDASGTSGSYAASPVNDSAKWGTSGNTGAFTYSYPIATPPSVGGAAPKLSLSYSSQDADGRTSYTNGQGSWVGDGWTMWPGSISRSYRSCSDDGEASTESDECWAGDNATLTLNGASHTLVHDDSTGVWKLADDDGSQVFELSGSDFGISNGLYNNTFWALRDRSGTVYVFGADHLPGADPLAKRLGRLGAGSGTIGSDASTNSAWGVPVYGNNSGEPCYTSGSFDSRSCMQGWQWNLDFVITPRSDVTVYSYTAEHNYYAAGTQHTLLSTPGYVRGGTLDQVAYGFKTTDYLAGHNPAARVEFKGDPSGRCWTNTQTYDCAHNTLNSTDAANWPDVPFDQNCPSSGTCTHYAPTFWTNDRLKQIYTQVWDTTPGQTAAWRTVDTYDLASDNFPDPADGDVNTANSTSPRAMWLDSITHTGNDTGGGGSAVPENSVTFKGSPYRNRVAGLIQPAVTPLTRDRMTTVTTETGEQITVSYASDTCSRTSPPAEDHDTLSCYPVRWTPPGYTAPILDWFNKYLVNTVDVMDLAGLQASAPTQHTSYQYLQNGAAWHHADDNITAPKYRAWGEFRGYSQVITRTGVTPDPITESVSKYLQGMDGDSTLSGTPKSASVTNDAGDTITDADPLSGTAYETLTYDQDGGTPQSRTMTVPWLSAATATHSRSTSGDTLPDLNAHYTGTTSAYNDTLISGSTWRLTDTVTSYDKTTGLVATVDDRGEVARDTHLPVNGASTPEKCTSTTYASNADGTITGLPDETLAVTGGCSSPLPNDAAHTLSDSKTFYDGSSILGTIPGSLDAASPGSGESTATTSLKDWNGTGGTARWTANTSVAYDAYGRVTSSTDALGRHAGTSYTSGGGTFLPTSITTTNPKGWTSTATLDVARGLPTSTSDVNGKVTTETYDGLGRLTAVWLPSHPHSVAANTSTPSLRYTYTVSNSGPSWVDTEQLRQNLTYHQDYKVYSAQQDLIEEQTTVPDGTTNARLVANTVYDSHGKPVTVDTPYLNTASNPAGTFTQPDTAGIPQETHTVYDGMGRTTSVIDWYNGHPQWTTSTSYPAGNQVDTVPPSGGTPTAVLTDGRGQKTELRQFHGTSDSGAYDSTTYSYDALGRQVQQKDSTGHTWTTGYDNLGDTVKSTDPDTGTMTAVFDDDKEQTQTISPRPGHAGDLTTVYDNLGRATDTYGGPATAQVHLAHTDFDPTGDLGQVKASTSYDTAGNAYTSTVTGYTDSYQATGSTTTVPGAALGGGTGLTYTNSSTYYPISGTVNTTTLPAVGTGTGAMPTENVGISYGDNDIPVAMGNDSTTYVNWMNYTALGQPMNAAMGTYGTQVVQQYEYIPGTSRLMDYSVAAQAADGTTGHTLDKVTYSYNDAGQKTSATDIQNQATTSSGIDAQCYQYDYLGRLAQAWTDTQGITTKPTGDPTAPTQVMDDGACATTTPSSATLGGPAPYWQTYSYDATGNRTSETDHAVPGLSSVGDTTTNSTYNATTAAAADSTTHAMPHGLATTHVTTGNGSSDQTLTYDAAGNTTEIKQGIGDKKLASGATLASGSELRSSNVRLAMQTDGNLVIYSLHTNRALWSTHTYNHPGATATMGTDGNLTVKSGTTTLWASGTASAGALLQLQDDNNLVIYSTTGTAVWSTGTYSAPQGARDIQLTYDYNGRLATTTQGSVKSSYAYDATGNLIARTDNGTTTVFVGDDQITYNSTGTYTGDTRSYAFPGAPTTIRTAVAGTAGTVLHFQAADPIGSATIDVRSDNKAILRRTYTPFGTDRTPNGNPATWPGTKGYIGGTQDQQTNLTNEGAREYAPALGRFLSHDAVLDTTTPQQWNGYAYSDNDPVNGSDPTGQYCDGCQQDGGAMAAATDDVGCSADASGKCRSQAQVDDAWRKQQHESLAKHGLLLPIHVAPYIPTYGQMVQGMTWDRRLSYSQNVEKFWAISCSAGFVSASCSALDKFYGFENYHGSWVDGALSAMAVFAGGDFGEEDDAFFAEMYSGETDNGIALGKQKTPGNPDALDEFGLAVGAKTYKQFDGKGSWHSQVIGFLNDDVTLIHVNLDGIDHPIAYAASGAKVNPAVDDQGFTRWEMYQLSKTPGAWDRVTWYRDGEPVPNPYGGKGE